MTAELDVSVGGVTAGSVPSALAYPCELRLGACSFYSYSMSDLLLII